MSATGSPATVSATTGPAVDVHAHVAVPAVEALIAGEPGYADSSE
jgi:hypothetical protein